MTTSTLITLIVAVLGSGGLATIITAIVNSKRNKSQSETEARAQFSAEFDVLAKNLFDEIKRQDTKIEHLDETVALQGEKILRLERQESSLRRYIYRLIDRIRALGEEPPTPPADLEL